MRLAHVLVFLAMLLSGAVGACQPAAERTSTPAVRSLPGVQDSIRAHIEAAITRGVEATRRQDINAYMAEMPDDLQIKNDSGRMLTREELRADALRSWAIIPKTLAIAVDIDSLRLLVPVTGGVGDSVYVWTAQRWERLMLRRDQVTVDTVLTTQSHRETWRRTRVGWRQYYIEELGGQVWLNGKPYDPE